MTIDDLMDGDAVHAFYGNYVNAMRPAQNSPQNPGEEMHAAQLVQSMLPEDATMEVQVVDISDSGKRPNILVTYTPPDLVQPKKGIVFAGVHTDCVPAQNEGLLRYREKTTEGSNKGLGRGVADNGANVLACLYMLKHWAKTHPRFSRPVTVTFSVDEEASHTDFGFPALMEEGVINPADYAAAVFADTPWAAWNTQGCGTYEIIVNVDNPGHSGVTISAATVAIDLHGTLQAALRDKFPLTAPYDRASILQANVLPQQKKEGLTSTVRAYTIAGDIRTHPAYPHEDVVDALQQVAESYRSALSDHPQVGYMAEKIHIAFAFTPIGDGYVMSDELIPVASRVIQAGYDATGIRGTSYIHSVCGGIPGLREFSEHGLVTIATGASGRPDVLMGYHAANEFVYTEDVVKGPAYLHAIALKFDQELLAAGR